jgi:hypothetical protein
MRRAVLPSGEFADCLDAIARVTEMEPIAVPNVICFANY